MKKIVVSIALAASLVFPANAQAAETKFVGGPLTNLEPSGATVHIALNNFPKLGGLYIQECVEGAVGARPTLCNGAVQLWVSTALGASFTPTADIIFKPTATFSAGVTAIDCRVSKCGVFLRYDHTVPGNLTEDQFIALTFKSGSASVAKPVDEISAAINSISLSTRVPMKISYRQIATLSATSKTGAPLTFASLAPACSLKSMTITALKGGGYCDIAITSPGNIEFAAVTAHFPLELIPGVQTIRTFSISSTKRSVLPKKTSFGEFVTYRASGSCTVAKNIVKAAKGSCTLDISAPGITALYQKLNSQIVTEVK